MRQWRKKREHSCHDSVDLPHVPRKLGCSLDVANARAWVIRRALVRRKIRVPIAAEPIPRYRVEGRNESRRRVIKDMRLHP